MAKKANSRLLRYILLANFFSISQLSFAIDNSQETGLHLTGLPETGSPETVSTGTEITASQIEKPGIMAKIMAIKKVNIKKTRDKTFYYAMGAACATMSIGSILTLIILFQKVKEIKESCIKDFFVGIALKIALYFENKLEYQDYMLPGAVVGLSANAAITAIMAAWMFRAGYKA